MDCSLWFGILATRNLTQEEILTCQNCTLLGDPTVVSPRETRPPASHRDIPLTHQNMQFCERVVTRSLNMSILRSLNKDAPRVKLLGTPGCIQLQYKVSVIGTEDFYIIA